MFKIKKKYHFVDKCPRCNSFATGRVVMVSNEREARQLLFNSVLRGELIETLIGFDSSVIEHNLFCLDCSSRWFGNVETRYVTDEEIINQQNLRGINEDLIAKYENLRFFNERQKIERAMMKQRKKAEKEAQKQKNKQKVKIKK